ncbi:MAG: PEP/pyruvate-binding domain-containing protein [Daejeonella sp.]|uniref:PEP/pyruvate-binding domain-containing protein n=1 Tax=Daejeonella sp. TaxID=2805397 RepID=UPI002735AA3F|nr:PEP/pyruvate-binding domain-containing protein [Daejeonella sp.]MDP3468661.1 PEP/pyruvate-binding domain-containing protein [Daejeonella sp.]
MKDYILKLKKITIADADEVGAKNAFLGEIFTQKVLGSIRVPDGFVITATAYRHFIAYNKLDGVHNQLISGIDKSDPASVSKIAKQARDLILGARIPGDLYDRILIAYHELLNGTDSTLAVRSSSIDHNPLSINEKDKHDTFLNVSGEKELISSVKKCFASLYSDQALIEDPDWQDRVISVGVQKMIRADEACSGYAYTCDPQSGFVDVIHVSGIWGIGLRDYDQSQVHDEFIVYKPNLHLGVNSIIQKKLGNKHHMVIYKDSGDHKSLIQVETSAEMRGKYILTDEEILTIANWGIVLENYYNCPVSIEWAKDNSSQDLFLLQAKPENLKKIKKNRV